jgi:DNA-binding CsgD family transcriptional regulator
MRYRTATPADAPACAALLHADGRCRLSAKQTETAPQVLAHLFSEKSDTRAHATVFEDGLGVGAPVLRMFTCAVFVHDGFFDALLAQPAPYYAATFYQAMLERNSPLLNTREIARANGARRLNLLNLHWVLREHAMGHTDNAELPELGRQAWQFSLSGYHIQRALFETYGDEFRALLQHAGIPAIHSFTRAANADCVPHWSLIERNAAAPSALSMPSLVLFGASPPKFGFTPRQQRVLLLALQGETDREMAARFEISVAAVRQAWDGIFERMPSEASLAHTPTPVRGPERRRTVVEYVRQHMEELRPYKSSRG